MRSSTYPPESPCKRVSFISAKWRHVICISIWSNEQICCRPASNIEIDIPKKLFFGNNKSDRDERGYTYLDMQNIYVYSARNCNKYTHLQHESPRFICSVPLKFLRTTPTGHDKTISGANKMLRSISRKLSLKLREIGIDTRNSMQYSNFNGPK